MAAMVEAKIANRREDLTRVSALVDSLCDEHGVPDDVRADIQVALDEALANVIAHAHPRGGKHAIRVALEVRGRTFEALVEDDGVAFNPLDAPKPATNLPLDARVPGGLGVHFMRSLMTSVSYARTKGRNRLTLRRRLDAVAGKVPVSTR